MRSTFYLLVFVCSLNSTQAWSQSRWLQQRLDVPPLYKLMSIAAADSNNYVISGDWFGGVGVFRTTDAGKSWRTIFDFPMGGVLSFYQIAHPTPNIIVLAMDSDGVYKKNENTTVFYQAGSILNSTDGGETWSQTTFGTLDTSKPTKKIEFVHMHDERWGLAAVTSSTLHQTLDGGRTWVPYPSPNTRMNFTQAIDVLDSMHVVLMMYRSDGVRMMYRTTTGGATWDSAQGPAPAFRDICMLNPAKGFAVGYDWQTSRGHLMKTEDGGLSWITIMDTAYSGGDPLVTIDFYDELRGIVSGRNGLIMMTEDGGVTWRREQLEYSVGVDMGAFFDVKYITSSKAIMVGGDGYYATLQERPLLPWPEFVVPSYGVPTSKTFTATWKESTGADRYEFILSGNSPDRPEIIYRDDLVNNSLDLVNLTEHSYHVQVRALSKNNQSNWSRVLFATNAVANVSQIPTASQLQVYPNPASGTSISIQWEAETQPRVLEIADVLGRVVLRMQLSHAKQLERIDVSTLETGTYNVLIHTQHGTRTTRLRIR
jgi:photosystem II stability/assembly factor-like uncharacterized protein